MEKKIETGRYVGKDGVIRWDTKRKYTKQELAMQRAEFSREAENGKLLCISDLMCNAGM